MSSSKTNVQLKQLKVDNARVSSSNVRTGFLYRLDRFLRRFLPGYDYLRRKRSGSRISLDARRVASDTIFSANGCAGVLNAKIRQNQKTNDVYLETGISKTDFCSQLDLLLRKKLLEQQQEQGATDVLLLEGIQVEDVLLVEKIEQNDQAIAELAIQMRQVVPYQAARQVETCQVATPQMETRQAEARQMETLQVETRQVETHQVETRQMETRQMETHKVETRQMETHQVETRQVVMTTLFVKRQEESDEKALDQEALNQETLNQETLNQEALNQETLNQEALDQMTSDQLVSEQEDSDKGKEKPMDLRQEETLDETSQLKKTQSETSQLKATQLVAAPLETTQLVAAPLETTQLVATPLESSQFEANPIETSHLETSQENLRQAVASQNNPIEEEQPNVGQRGEVRTCQTDGFPAKDVPMEIVDLHEFDLVEPYPSLDRIVEQAIEMARDQGAQNR